MVCLKSIANNLSKNVKRIPESPLQVPVFVTIRSKWEEFIVVGPYSLFLEFEFSRSALFLHFSFKNCVENKVKAISGLFDWPMQSHDISTITYKRQSGNFQTHFLHILRVTTSDYIFFRFKITCTTPNLN